MGPFRTVFKRFKSNFKNLTVNFKDGNGSDLTQYPRDPNLIGSDLGRYKMDLDIDVWI